ncbi:MAG: site-2 protease family protein [Ruminococcus sp.]|nr:site-2 protease family protein [Ruminococcus sp.]
MLIDLIRDIRTYGSVDFTGVLIQLAVMALMIFLILPVHEFAHAGAAYLLGDKDIKHRGRLSLNPLVHIDPFGALCMLLFGFGWAKPVPVNPNRFKYPKLYMGLCAFAGPLANILCGMFGGALMLLLAKTAPSALVEYKIGDYLYLTEIGEYVWMFLSYYILINASLAIFNLLPVPPLDGSKILFIFLPDRIVNFFYRYQQFTSILIFALLYMGALDGILGAGREFVLKLCLFFQ